MCAVCILKPWEEELAADAWAEDSEAFCVLLFKLGLV